MQIAKMLVSSGKTSIKCPYSMRPEFITVHNTYNDAKAENEIAYMIGNNNTVSYHFAVDDNKVVQGLPLDRNGWHAGDGSRGNGNRKSIAIEICYSKSGGTRFDRAEALGAMLVAKLLLDYGLGFDRVRPHKYWSGKNCPHRTLDRGWNRFMDMVKKEVNILRGTPAVITSSSKKSNEEIAREVSDGKWGNGEERKRRLANAGYDYRIIQAIVNGKPIAQRKSISQLADEVIAGKWGNGSTRARLLTKEGYDASAVQREVNRRYRG